MLTRRLSLFAVTVFLAFFSFSFFTSSIALAHNNQTDSSPKSGDTLTTAPTTWTVSFAKSVPLNSASGEVVNSDGTRTPLTQFVHGSSDSVIVFSLPSGLTGSVTARWRLVGVDGHIVSGRVGFVVQAAVSNPTVPDSLASQPPTTLMPAESTTPPFQEVSSSEATAVSEPIRVSLRSLQYLGIILLGGMLVAELAIAGGAMTVPLGRRFMTAGVALLAASSFIQTLIFNNDLREPSESSLSSLFSIFSSTPGAMLATKTVLSVLLIAVLFRSIQEGVLNRSTQLHLLLIVPMFLITLAYGGHSRSQSLPWLGIPVDALHVTSMAIWVGGLIAMLLIVIPNIPHDRALEAFQRFSFIAEKAVIVLVITGAIQMLRLHSGVTTVFTSSHGLLLLVKVLIVVLMLRLAAKNRSLLMRKTRTSQTSPSRLRAQLMRSTLLESAMGTVVIVLTATLVAISPT
ncbi:MAG: copper resistance protein CopC/CopD [Ilumatobacteraceae bacterium]|jgi:copper transport protein|nr:copper resistance protein CopC/CopD [Ilumatobacteraceae bacterium]